MKNRIAKANFIIIIAVTIFMGVALLASDREAQDIALVGVVMWVLNAGVPLNLVLDKIIELKKGGN